MRPPPITRFIHYPITAGTALLAIGVTAVFMAGRVIDPMMMNVLAFEGEPWRLVTSILPHGGVIHLLFNVIWLWIFGTALETTWGAARTLAIFLFFAVVTSLAEYAVFDGGIGLSGVGYGLFGLLAVLQRRDVRFAGTVDTRTTRLFIAWFFLCIAFTVANVMRIGNVAHGVGGVIGACLGFVIAGRGWRERAIGGGALAVIVAASVLGATMFRPLINQSATGGNDSAVLGYELLHVKQCDKALHHLQRAVEVTPSDSGSWFNLGVCNEQLGHPDEARAAFKRAYELDGKDADYKDAYARSFVNAAVALAKAGDHAKAVDLYKQALAIDPNDKVALFDLSLAHEALGDKAAAIVDMQKLVALEPSSENKERLASLETAGQHGMHHRFDNVDEWVKVFDDPARDEWQQPDKVIAALELAPTLTVADIGAGTGYFAVRIAPHVEKVIATDIEPTMVAYMQDRAEREHIANLTALLPPADAPGFDPVDRILIVDVWHHLDNRADYAKKLAAALKPGGFVAVVDFKHESKHGPPPEHRLAPETIAAELQAGGLKTSVIDTLPDQFIVIGRR